MNSRHFPDQATEHLVRGARSIADTEAGETACDSIAQLLELRAQTHPHKPWMVFYADPEKRTQCTYAEFLDRVRRTAHLLHRSGIRRGDAVATMAHNHEDTVVQYFAAWLLGAVVVPVNTGEDDRRISYILENAGVKLLFVRTPFVGRLEAILPQVPLLTTVVEAGEEPTGRHRSYRDAVASCDPGFTPPEPPQAEDDALIVYTSGTTGHPKGVVLSQRNLLADARGISEWHGIDERCRMMCVLPIHHVNGTVVTLLTPMYAGGSVVLNQKFHTEKFFARIAAERVQVASVVPTLLQYLLHERIDHRRFDLSHFRHIICGAGPLTCELAEKFERTFSIPIVHGYGLSETTCYSCFLPVDLKPEEHRSWLSDYGFPSIGVPIPQNEM